MLQFDGPDPNVKSVRYLPNGIQFEHASMKMITGILSIVGRPVTDETNLTGLYTFTLEFASRRGTPILDPPIDSDQPSIFAAIENVGLKLESRQGTISDYIIDRVERIPSEN